MQQIIRGFQYLFDNFFRSSTSGASIWELFLQHLQITGISLGVALVIALPVGVLISRVKWLRGPVLAVLGVVYTIPSLALFVLLITVMGIGRLPAIVALIAYAQLVLVRNIMVGLTGIDQSVINAAQGMGMNNWQQFYRIELPLALPLIIAGLRLAAVAIISIGTIAAFINAGGLGVLLFTGIQSGNQAQIVAGSIVVSLLAVIVNAVLRFAERRSTLAILGEDG